MRSGLAFAKCSGGCCNGFVQAKGGRGGGISSADLNDAANKLVGKGWRYLEGIGWTCPKHGAIRKREVSEAYKFRRRGFEEIGQI